MSTVAFVSFRFGGPDGVSVESEKWMGAFARLGWTPTTVAGGGRADIVLPGLGIDASLPPGVAEIAAALVAADLVVVENLCSLPLNPAAAKVVSSVLAGRPAVLHHHDLPWQRPQFATTDYRLPDDPCWRHVVINDLSRGEMARRGLQAVTVRNAFDTDAPPGDRETTRALLGLNPRDRLVLQPTRAIARKNVPAALAFAEAIGAVYWLLGPAEEGYGPELTRILRGASIRAIHGPAATMARTDPAHAYAAADAVVFPSSWEGFGNPVIESAIFRRPLAIHRYPVAQELAAFGFRWFDTDDPPVLGAWLDHPDATLLEHNRRVAIRWFSLPRLDRDIDNLLASLPASVRR